MLKKIKIKIKKNHPEGLLKSRLLGPTPSVTDSVCLEWVWGFAFLPGDADATDLGHHLDKLYYPYSESKLCFSLDWKREFALYRALALGTWSDSSLFIS